MKHKTYSRRGGTRLLLAFLWLLATCSFFLCSCNVTRVCTTKSEYTQKGDSTVTIVTQTVETYDAKKNNSVY